MKNPRTIRLEVEKLREDTRRKRMLLNMAISNGNQGWAIPFFQEQLTASEVLLAFATQKEPSQASIL
jgi:hypothetical protein